MKGKFTIDLGWDLWAVYLEILTLCLGGAHESVFLMPCPGGFDTRPGLETTQTLEFLFLRWPFKDLSNKDLSSTYCAPLAPSSDNGLLVGQGG